AAQRLPRLGQWAAVAGSFHTGRSGDRALRRVGIADPLRGGGAARALRRSGRRDRRGSGRVSVGRDCVTELHRKLPPGGTTIFTVMSRRARELGALNLGQGFPDYDIDPRLGELVAAAMHAGHNQYAPMEGLPLLRERIAEKLARCYGLD